jgi:hypothetical protein
VRPVAEGLVARAAAPAERGALAFVEDGAVGGDNPYAAGHEQRPVLGRASRRPGRGRRRCADTSPPRSAPDGQRATAASISAAVAASTSTHGRRLSSKTCGSKRTQFCEWKQSRGSHSTTISSVAYSFVTRSRFAGMPPDVSFRRWLTASS